MYCLQCGTGLPQDAKFCSKCGAKVSSDKSVTLTAHITHEHKPAQEVLLDVKPAVVSWLVLARYIPLQLNLTISGGLLFGLLIVCFHLIQGNLVHPYRPFIFFAAVFFIAVPLFVYLGYRKTVKSTHYQFYADRLEYYEGFWKIEHKTLYYKHVTEITLHRNLLQRLAGVGSIRLLAPSLGGRNPGIGIPDVKHSEEIFAKIQKIVQEY